jgi:hypothetical protein
VLKRLIGQVVVVGLALSLVTACSSASKKDCNLLYKSLEVMSGTYKGEGLDPFVTKISLNQSQIRDPKLQGYVKDYLEVVKAEPSVFKKMNITAIFLDEFDNYCKSL